MGDNRIEWFKNRVVLGLDIDEDVFLGTITHVESEKITQFLDAGRLVHK